MSRSRICLLWALLSALAVVSCAVFIAGCGGGQQKPQSASATLTPLNSGRIAIAIREAVKSRSATRSVARAASLRIIVKGSNGFTTSKLINRDAEGFWSDVADMDVPVGTVEIEGQAYSEANGGGNLQDVGKTSVQVQAGTETVVKLTFQPVSTTINGEAKGFIVIEPSDDVEPTPAPTASATPTSATPAPLPSPPPTPAPAETEIQGWVEGRGNGVYPRGSSVQIYFQLIDKQEQSLVEKEVCFIKIFWAGGPAFGKQIAERQVNGEPESVYYTIPEQAVSNVYATVEFRGSGSYKPSSTKIPIPIRID